MKKLITSLILLISLALNAKDVEIIGTIKSLNKDYQVITADKILQTRNTPIAHKKRLKAHVGKKAKIIVHLEQKEGETTIRRVKKVTPITETEIKIPEKKKNIIYI